ncbi:hypothetical protein B0H13DRAFT_1868646 [Mycena leptocephala]|nr:hypothetical protein B0H13DRAFT_1868646 [Mycena leptocephala]
MTFLTPSGPVDSGLPPYSTDNRRSVLAARNATRTPWMWMEEGPPGICYINLNAHPILAFDASGQSVFFLNAPSTVSATMTDETPEPYPTTARNRLDAPHDLRSRLRERLAIHRVKVMNRLDTGGPVARSLFGGVPVPSPSPQPIDIAPRRHIRPHADRRVPDSTPGRIRRELRANSPPADRLHYPTEFLSAHWHMADIHGGAVVLRVLYPHRAVVASCIVSIRYPPGPTHPKSILPLLLPHSLFFVSFHSHSHNTTGHLGKKLKGKNLKKWPWFP